MTLPWPHPMTFPNAKRRLHWSKYQPHCNRARGEARLVTRGWMNANPAQRPDANAPLSLRVTFQPPNRIRRDDDGMIGAFKHLRDGIADALGMDDRLFRPEYHFAEPLKPGAVIVEIIGGAA
ncbi:hypothetical protein SKP52_02500 [Sphingopyxis fribergensis]|uniref:Uncharacterized protein n=2 Tax=Sphingopyxis fribergensis TaxID=1515612 RepID=A0A0A7PBR3_9SPHN|nr:hypothetical protein SKP52_02500 [Sphingopyxis fribergensis]